LDDFAGTGYFSREYLVSTYKLKNINISAGIGWGKFTGESSIDNPLNIISENFKNRPIRNYTNDFGGTPTYDEWFKGDAAFFGGMEFLIPNFNKLKLKVEYDPFNYFDLSALNRTDALFSKRKKESKINFGFSYPINNFIDLETSYIKGNSLNLSFIVAITFNDRLSNKPTFEPKIQKQTIETGNKRVFYEDLLYNLNSNRLLLQTADLDNKELDIAISTADHRDSIRSSSYAAYISKKVSDLNNIDINNINVVHLNAGIELNKISYIANHLEENKSIPYEVRYTNIEVDSGNKKSYSSNEFRPIVNFPVIFSSFQPGIKNHIGAPEKVYFGGVYLQHFGEIQFNRNLILTSELDYSIFNNFTDTVTGPDSKLPHVRTEVIQYLKKEGVLISRLQLDYLWSPRKDLYAKLSGGLFETMYGGVGGQVLYKPFKKNYSLSLDSFQVKRRDYDQRTSFLDYETFTGHFNFAYYFPHGIESNISVGKYLAKDKGYTFDINRTTKSGFKAGIYFTRTNISKELFGEGSFDKGFYFQIPLDLFLNSYQNNYSTFKLSPLTRDGGAKLIYEKDLKGMIYSSTYKELIKQRKNFLD
tara:strand:+ start:3107 stop:4870 length:1764 start_codon:yes stop_codon:yes gene_type:complete